MLRKIVVVSLWIERFVLLFTMIAISYKTAPGFWSIFMFIVMLDITFQTRYLFYGDFWYKLHRLKVVMKASCVIDKSYHSNICYRIFPDLKSGVIVKGEDGVDYLYWAVNFIIGVLSSIFAVVMLRLELGCGR